MSSETPKSINLFYTEGSSDKVYQLQLAQSGAGWVVNFQYGRRHSTLKAGTKTENPLAYTEALKAYDKLLAEKTKKGYTPDQSGSLYQSSQDINDALSERFTGIIPQLLNPVRSQEDIEELIKSDDDLAQEKHDGERRSISYQDTDVIGANRDGLRVSLPEKIVTDVKKSKNKFVIDGEIMGERFVAFDLLEHNGQSTRTLTAENRLKLLSKIVSSFSHIELVETAVTEEEKRDLIARLKKRRAEGVVFKKKDSVYVPGRPASGGSQRKWKFVESATVRVGVPHKTKRSVSLETDGDDGVIPLGNVTIPTNYDKPSAGAIVEVEYLYLYKNGSLYQPQYKGLRADKNTPDDLSSFKLKADTHHDVDSDDDENGEDVSPSQKKEKIKM